MSANDELKDMIGNLSERLNTLESSLVDCQNRVNSMEDNLDSTFDKDGLNSDLFKAVQARGAQNFKIDHFVNWVKSTRAFKSWLISERKKGDPNFDALGRGGEFLNAECKKIMEFTI